MTRQLYFFIAIISFVATSFPNINAYPDRRAPFHQHAHLRHVQRFPPNNRKLLRRENPNAIVDESGDIAAAAAAAAGDNINIGNTTDPPVCGQYGFRCIDDQSFQICELTDIDGQREDANVPHECPDDLVCNEDDNAFCSPRFRMLNMEPPTSARRCESDKYKRDVVREAAKPFECQAYGMFPDATNSSMFWFCDRGCREHQFETKHMMCGQERVFDADRNECISAMADETDKSKQTAAKDRRTVENSAFSCNGRSLGKYANDANCRKYHLCLPAKSDTHTFDEVIFMCPDGMAYDPQRERCDRAAVERRCSTANAIAMDGEGQPDNGDADGDGDDDDGGGDSRCHCATGTRSHDADSKQCNGYLLCVERVKLKLQCPQGERFNSTLLLCQPKNMVECSAGN